MRSRGRFREGLFHNFKSLKKFNECDFRSVKVLLLGIAHPIVSSHRQGLLSLYLLATISHCMFNFRDKHISVLINKHLFFLIFF